MRVPFEQVVVGRNRETAVQFLGVALVLPVVVAAFFAYGLHGSLGPRVRLPFELAAMLFLPAFVHAYRNDGVLVTVALAAFAGEGFDVYRYAVARNPPLAESALRIVQSTDLVEYGVAIGLLAFVLGAVLRRAVEAAAETAARR